MKKSCGQNNYTVLCADKKKLLVIEKTKKPRCFKQISLQKLPVEYHTNKNAWMILAIFWQHCDTELDKTKKAICLILDNCTAHHNVPLKNIKIEFLPPNSTSLI